MKKEKVHILLEQPDPTGEELWFSDGCYCISISTDGDFKEVFTEDKDLAEFLFETLKKKHGV